MKTLTIFYDARCGLCQRFKQWLLAQPARVALRFIPYDSGEALRLFPRMHEVRGDRDIVVLADDGRWWQGTSAWLTCLWATRNHVEWSYRLAAPALKPFVEKAVHLLSENRLRLSSLLRSGSDRDLARELGEAAGPACESGACAMPALHTAKIAAATPTPETLSS